MHVHRALTPVESDPKRVIEKDTKTHANARLAIDDETVEILKAFRVAAIERALAVGIAFDDDTYVFTSVADGSEP